MFGSTKKKLLKTLSPIVEPEGGRIEGLQIDGKHVTFTIAVEPDRAQAMETVRQKAETTANSFPGIEKATAILTAERPPAPPQSPLASATAKPEQRPAPNIKYVVAIASGKGGVGKSTVAANLAVALAKAGQKVGLMDADIFGPSVPKLLGLKGDRPGITENNMMVPPQAHGLKVMSMGFLVPPGKSVVWRGAMVHKGLLQMYGNTDWGALDILVIDMPPGTGDAQLTIAQNIPLAGAVIVSTPQDLALIDARKGIEMFGQVNVPILGLIENMSTYHCPECGHEEAIFGHGGAEKEAQELGVPFLGRLPLAMAIRSAADDGTPITLSAPDSAYAKSYKEMAEKLAKHLKNPPAADKTGSCGSGCGCH